MKYNLDSIANKKSSRVWNDKGKIQTWHKIFTSSLSFIGNHKVRK